MMRQPFTQHYPDADLPQGAPIVGYYKIPAPVASPARGAPWILPDTGSPIVAPTRGPFGYNKAAVSPQVTPAYWASQAGAAGLTYKVG